jgi:tetratricopeptide (TPR) repeat protein
MGHTTKKGVAMALALALTPATQGCLAARTPAWSTPSSTAMAVTPAAQASPELVARGELEWERRGEEAHARAAVEAWRQALELAPTDAVLWARLARAQYFLADAHLSNDPARAAEAHELFADAVTSAERSLLARLPSIGVVLRSGQHFADVLAALEERDVPGLYWRTMALSRWSRPNGMFVQAALRAELRLSMARVAELQRDYDGAGADRFLGETWASTSGYLGGDLERAREHFEYALSVAPDHLATRVAYATVYAPKVGDRALYEAELRRVIAADPGGADVAAENVVEQRRAQAALDRIAQVFGS